MSALTAWCRGLSLRRGAGEPSGVRGHDAQIGDFAQLCPGVCLGRCEVGEGALLGTLAGTIPLKHVGAWATLGAGSVALRDVAEGAAVVRLAARDG